MVAGYGREGQKRMDNLVRMPDRLSGAKAGPAAGFNAGDKVSGAADKMSGAAQTAGGSKSPEQLSLLADLVERIGNGRAVMADGQSFREVREFVGASLRELETSSGVSRTMIAEYETEGAISPALEHALVLGLRRLAYAQHQRNLMALTVIESRVASGV